jgi:hypothetical protein
MDDRINKRFDELARLDERHAATVRRVDNNEARLTQHSERLADLEQDTRANTQVASVIERVFWIVVAAVTSIFTYLFKDSL